jgi:outer membrane protein assembly factor BamB
MRNLIPAVCLLAMGLSVGAIAQRSSTSNAATNDWPMFGYDVGRSSSSAAPTGITAENVASLERQQAPIDGIVDASAIYLDAVQVNGARHDTLFVTTSFGKTLAIDADNGAVLWTHVPGGFESWVGTRQITNSTPVADPARDFIYASHPGGQVEKLAVSDGHALWSTPITKLPAREKMDSPLGFFRGRVIAVTAGYIGDAPPYQGHVSILDAGSGRLLQTWNSLCSDRHELIDPPSCPATRSAIWGRAGAVIDAATGEIFVATGNGPWDGKTSWGDATLQLDPNAEAMIGNYTPSNNEELNARDADVGSTSPVLLGGGFLAQGGKDGTIRLLTTQMMKGTDPHRGGELQIVPTPSGARLLTAPAVMKAAGSTWLFAADGGGSAAWTFANGQLQPAWKNTNPGTSPAVAGGLLFIYDPAGSLRVYDPQTGRVLATLECGRGHWNSPIVVDGRIILPEGSANPGRGGAPTATSAVVNIWRVPRK